MPGTPGPVREHYLAAAGDMGAERPVGAVQLLEGPTVHGHREQGLGHHEGVDPLEVAEAADQVRRADRVRAVAAVARTGVDVGARTGVDVGRGQDADVVGVVAERLDRQVREPGELADRQ